MRQDSMSRFWACSILAPALLVLCLPAPAVEAAKPKPEWNQTANIKDAANRLAKLQRAEGSEAVLKFLEACYKTHTLASKYTQGLEGCMAQDYMLSQVLATIYTKVPPEALAKMRAPSPDLIARSMRGRFQAIFAQYQITQPEADAFKTAVERVGFPIFIKAIFPKAAQDKASNNKDGGPNDAVPKDSEKP
ncbi:MAG: hypothetical protein ABL907_20070 [Hyphomicrobium sp.]